MKSSIDRQIKIGNAYTYSQTQGHHTPQLSKKLDPIKLKSMTKDQNILKIKNENLNFHETQNSRYNDGSGFKNQKLQGLHINSQAGKLEEGTNLFTKNENMDSSHLRN